MTNTEIHDFIDNAIKENKVMLFMKGTPEQPACGFSMRTSGALNALGVQYAALDILPDPRIREELSGLSGWPTIPQLFIDGELVGGCDIVTEMYETGELAEKLGVEMPEDDEGDRGDAGQQGAGTAREPAGLAPLLARACSNAARPFAAASRACAPVALLLLLRQGLPALPRHQDDGQARRPAARRARSPTGAGLPRERGIGTFAGSRGRCTRGSGASRG